MPKFFSRGAREVSAITTESEAEKRIFHDFLRDKRRVLCARRGFEPSFLRKFFLSSKFSPEAILPACLLSKMKSRIGSSRPHSRPRSNQYEMKTALSGGFHRLGLYRKRDCYILLANPTDCVNTGAGSVTLKPRKGGENICSRGQYLFWSLRLSQQFWASPALQARPWESRKSCSSCS